MKALKLLITSAIAISTALADNHLTSIRDQAARLGQEFKDIGGVVRARNFDSAEVKRRVDAIDADIESLKKMAAEFESANPSVTTQSNKDWKSAREMIHLIDIFHEQKAQLLGSNPTKTRTLIKSHADNLSRRAYFLQDASNRLLRSIGGGI